MKPLLIADCYLHDPGAAPNFLACLDGVESRVVRAAREPVPEDWSAFSAAIVTGSAASVLDDVAWIDDLARRLRAAVEAGVPVLGVCFGHQLLARALFGPAHVRRGSPGELGWVRIERTRPHPLLDRFPGSFSTFQSHFDEVTPVPEGVTVLARSAACAVQAFAVDGRRAFGVQFHAEIGPAEARDLVNRRAPDFGLEPERLLRDACDSSALCVALMTGFLDLVRG